MASLAGTETPDVKMVSEYLDHALSFERLAADESQPELKAQFLKQAEAYRKLATDRAARYGLLTPQPSDRSR